MYGGEKSPAGIKRQNVWMPVWKCFICLILVMCVFFIHFWAVVDAWSVKRTIFWFYMYVFTAKRYLCQGCGDLNNNSKIRMLSNNWVMLVGWLWFVINTRCCNLPTYPTYQLTPWNFFLYLHQNQAKPVWVDSAISISSNIKQYQAIAISHNLEMQFQKIKCDWFTNEHHQGSCDDFA